MYDNSATIAKRNVHQIDPRAPFAHGRSQSGPGNRSRKSKKPIGRASKVYRKINRARAASLPRSLRGLLNESPRPGRGRAARRPRFQTVVYSVEKLRACPARPVMHLRLARDYVRTLRAGARLRAAARPRAFFLIE